MIVLDASAVVEILLQTADGAPVSERLLTSDVPLHAPYLIDIEVSQALRRFVARGEVAPGRAFKAIEAFPDLPMERHSHLILLPRVWQLKENLSSYDATYVALAEALDATLLTRDGRIARAPGHSARIEVF